MSDVLRAADALAHAGEMALVGREPADWKRLDDAVHAYRAARDAASADEPDWQHFHNVLGDIGDSVITNVEDRRWAVAEAMTAARETFGAALARDAAPAAPTFMQIQNAIEQSLGYHGAGYQDQDWFTDVIHGATEGAVAAIEAARGAQT